MGSKESETFLGDRGLKDFYLKEQSKKMEKLGLSLKIIQDGMCQKTPITVKTIVGEAAKFLDSLFNNHECLMQSGVEIQKRLEPHSATTKMGIFRNPRSASVGDTPETKSKGEKREAHSPPEERMAKKERAVHRLCIPEATRSQASKEIGEWQLVEEEKRKKRNRKKR